MAINEEYLKKFNRCILEYTYVGNTVDEDDDPSTMGGDPAMGGGADLMGGDPAMGGGADPMGGDPAMGGGADPMGGDPAMGGGADPMGGDPAMGGGEGQGPQGFNPQPDAPQADGGMGAQQGNVGMGGAPTDDPSVQAPQGEAQSDEEVIDVDDLTKSQENTEEKVEKIIDGMSSKFEEVLGAIKGIEDRMNSIERSNDEIKKNNPTPMQKMSLRSTKSAPYAETPEDWWQTKAPANYSPEDDKNGEDDVQYQITKSDIDNFSDWNSASKELNDLHNLLGY